MAGVTTELRAPRRFGALLLLAMGLVVAGCAVEAGTAEDDVSAAQGEALTIPTIFANAATGSCMDAPVTSAGAIPPVTQRACNGGTTQRFSRGDASWFALRDVGGRCLQVTATPSGTVLTRATCAGPGLGTSTSSQRFALGPPSPGPKGLARTLKTATGLCVDGAASTFVGMPLRVSPCTGATSQLWSVLEGPATP